MSTAASTFNNVSIALRADGKNWKDWDKQVRNCDKLVCQTAAAMSTATPTSNNVSIALRANGKNWKDWDKQLQNIILPLA
ncbi:hypothetical protein EJ02DRAFT_451561 [Clathrospora elynae]|uniref:Uncharacterized protein n=1 Tax=Clathrospora elynae TaxID=706981 RepID=A0A6A5T0P5_9PLEO|nr:hypothetical protein EJ02DRAFT_451561 [Clathrospora elynae]